MHYAKKSLSVLKLVLIAFIIIFCIIAVKYKPAYAVTVSGEQIGFVADEERLEKKITNFINKMEECVAVKERTYFMDYDLVLVSRETETMDESLYAKVKDSTVVTYKTFAITVGGEEKTNVTTQEAAQELVNKVKEGVEEEVGLDLAIVDKFDTTLATQNNDEALNILNGIKNDKVAEYERKKAEEAARKAEEERRQAEEAARRAAASGSVNTSLNVSYDFAPISIAFARPVEGSISSRFGARSSIRSSVHTGLDIASSMGTPIKACASGIVTYAGYKGAYGNLMVIDHGNGVQTYYAHCSALNVSAGQSVEQGQHIGNVGSTGNSTGPHLHLEIRVNGVAQNPQNYLYQ